MGNEEISKERTAEPVSNVGAVRRIPVVVWEEISSDEAVRIAADMAFRFVNPEVHKVVRVQKTRTSHKFYHLKRQAFII